MPVTGILSGAASFLYAVSALLSGAQNNAAIQETLRTNFESSPTHFIPLTLRSSNATAMLTKAPQLPVQFHTPIALALTKEPKYEAHSYYTTTDTKGKTLQIKMPHNSRNPDQAPISNTSADLKYFLASRLKSFSRANLQPLELNYYDGQTIATVFTDASGNVTRCTLIEINKPEEAEKTLQRLAYEKKIIEKATFSAMLTIITACQSMEPTGVGVIQASESSVVQPSNNLLKDTHYNMWSIVSGILPGTKWCGLGDIATNYDDLGQDRNLDKCCRAHDHCPKKIKAFRSRYGLVNWSLYTKSHCECDAFLYNCLKKSESVAAEMLGNFYFNVLKVECIEEDKSNCLVRSNRGCKKWRSRDENRLPQKLLFREAHLEF